MVYEFENKNDEGFIRCYSGDVDNGEKVSWKKDFPNINVLISFIIDGCIEGATIYFENFDKKDVNEIVRMVSSVIDFSEVQNDDCSDDAVYTKGGKKHRGK